MVIRKIREIRVLKKQPSLVFLTKAPRMASVFFCAICGKLSQHDLHLACITMRRMTTIYIEIYIIGSNDETVGRK